MHCCRALSATKSVHCQLGAAYTQLSQLNAVHVPYMALPMGRASAAEMMRHGNTRLYGAAADSCSLTDTARDIHCSPPAGGCKL